MDWVVNGAKDLACPESVGKKCAAVHMLPTASTDVVYGDDNRCI